MLSILHPCARLAPNLVHAGTGMIHYMNQLNDALACLTYPEHRAGSPHPAPASGHKKSHGMAVA
jgi:hypothetical protein